MPDHNRPIYEAKSFNCPHCSAFAQQNWKSLYEMRGSHYSNSNLHKVTCLACGCYSLWKERIMVWPSKITAPMPNNDMPENVKKIYSEARTIVSLSPRAAAALLRLALQKLMIHLNEKGKNINDDIGRLVKKGLPVRLQKALDVIRITGNNAVHPGELDMKDNIQTAQKLFKFLNMIVDAMITQPKEINELYDEMPDGAKKGVKKRDGKK